MDNHIRVESISLTELFNRPLTIPEYQRPYVWNTYNIDQFFKQFRDYRESPLSPKPMFYMGGIILHQDEPGNIFNIVDGQQRITTLAIMRYIKHGHEFSLSYNNLLSCTQIKENAEHMRRMADEPNELNFDDINVTVITTTSLDDAYNFFETINTAGRRLSGLDIIKAHHLRKVEDRMEVFARKWEEEQAYLDQVIKILIRSRQWNTLKLDFSKEFISRRAGENEWKRVVTEEFSINTLKNGQDTAYSFWHRIGNLSEQIGEDYFVRQPLSDGENFIHYLLSYASIYKKLFTELGGPQNELYKDLYERVIGPIDGTVDLKAVFQVALVCYAGKFGLTKLDEASLWIFRFIYSARVTAESRLQETTVIKHIYKFRLIDRILTAFTHDELVEWLQDYSYEPSNEALDGVKGRYVDKVKKVFNFEIQEKDINDFDQELVNAIKNRIRTKPI
jgi:hypothetical protein